MNSEESVRKIAKDLEIHEKTLYGWLSDYRKKHNLEVLNPKPQKFSSIESIEEENKRLRKENAQLKKAKEILKKAAAYFAKKNNVKYAFIKEYSKQFNIKLMCRVFKVSRSCYYRWLSIEK